MDLDQLFSELDEKRGHVAKRLAEDPLPSAEGAAAAVRAEIARLGLEAHVADLDLSGFTVLPPEKLAAAALVDRLLEAVDRLYVERINDVQDSTAFGFGMTFHHPLGRDRVFEEALMCEAPLSLITYLLGYHAKLSAQIVQVKEAGTPPLALHADVMVAGIPAPWPAYAQAANASWVLSDYSRDEGALCVVPGSHLLCRAPTSQEWMMHQSELVQTVEARAGSVIVWHGNTWHGAQTRTVEGKRKSMAMLYIRRYLQSQGPYNLTTSMDALERNVARFGVVTGLAEPTPWDGLGGRGRGAPRYGNMSSIYVHE